MKQIELKEGWIVRVPDHFGFWDFVHKRFDPLSAAIATTQIVGGVGQYRETVAEGKIAEDTSYINAALLEHQANEEARQAAEEIEALKKYGKELQGAQRSAFAQGGVVAEGTPTTVLANTAGELALQEERLRRAGTMAYRMGLFEAQTARALGKYQKKIAKRKALWGLFGAGGTALTGLGNIKFGGGGLQSSLEKTLGFKLTKAGKTKSSSDNFKSKLKEAVKKK